MRQNLQRNTRSYDIIPSHYLGIISFFFLSVHTTTIYYSWLMASNNKSIIFTNTIILVNMLTSASRTYEWMFAFVPLFVLLSRQILILQFHGRNDMFTSSYSNSEKYYDHLKRSNIGKKRLFFPLFASWFNWSTHLLSLHICHMIRKHVLTSNHANPCWIASQSRIAHNFSANCRVSRFGPKSIRAQGGNKICLLLKGLFLMNSAIDSIKEIYLHDYWHWL